MPEGATVELATSVGQSFGLIGVLVDAGLQSRRDGTFNAMLAREQFMPPGAFVARVAEGLRMQGYMVADAQATRPNANPLNDYPAAAVDAYLDLVVSNYGYVAAGISGASPYRPSFTVRAKRVRASDKVVLMQDTIAYNPTQPGQPGDHSLP